MKLINDASVWTGNSLGSKEKLVYKLNTRHLEEFKKNVDEIRRHALATYEIKQKDFPLSSMADDLVNLRKQLEKGQGLLVIRGLPIDTCSIQELEIIYWGLGTHFGVAVSQSVMGDRLGHVIDVTDTDPNARAYRNRQELNLHTDFSDIVSFLCVRKAKSGGLSWFASASAVHNEILRVRPDVLRILYRGFYWHRYEEEKPGESPVTPWRVPVFSSQSGNVSCRFIRSYITEATTHDFVDNLSGEEHEALDMFESVSHADGMPIKFMLEPGEAVFINNFTTLHARESFVNHLALNQRRLLLRLWLTVPNGRPIVPEIQIYDSGREGGVPAQPGKTPSYARKT